MANQLAINAAADAGSRALITVAAIEALAREVGAYPGRKNLLWLAENFPIALGAQLDETKILAPLHRPRRPRSRGPDRQRADCRLSH